MSKIECCKRKQDAKIYVITPEISSDSFELILFLDRCSHCGASVLISKREDLYGQKIPDKRLSGGKAQAYLSKASIIWEPTTTNIKQSRDGFYLYYSAYGVKLKCFENFSTMKPVSSGLDQIIIDKIN